MQPILNKAAHFLMVSMLLTLYACSNKTNTVSTDTNEAESDEVMLTNEQLALANIKTELPQMRMVSSVLKATGVIDVPPQNLVSISLPMGGYLKYTKLLPGMHFNKGEEIAVVEDIAYIQLQQEYLEAKAQLNFLQPEYERQQFLNKERAASDKQLQQAKAEYEKLLIQLKALEQKLALIGINAQKLTPENLKKSVSVVAPIEGFVTKVNVNIGKYVNPTDVLFELVNPDDIHLNLNIFEKDLDNLYVNQPLVAYTNFNTSKKYPCSILLIGKDITNERSTSVHCHFEKYDKNLHPGMYMNAEIELKKSNALTVPNEAIVMFNNKQFVFIAENKNTFKLTEIKTGIAGNAFTEIDLEYIAAIKNKTIVTSGAYTLLMKLKNTGEEE